ncbi:MAG: transposase [Defluviicoccus sp.]|nr:transposase [Defluviicoccus sp.]MDE0274567.1 transposase [Defluviicoccus sp.]
MPGTDKALAANGFSFHLRRDRLRRVRRREGRYLLRSNMTAEDPATLWRLYMQLTEIEQAFKELKHDLAIRPIFHQREERIEAHIFVSFIAYCLLVTLKNLARPQASGLTPRAIIEAFATIQMVDVHLPTTDGRHLVLPRHTRPNKEHELLLHQLGMTLPQQPAPRIAA